MVVMPTVHNKYKSTAPSDAVYIGRPSKWGNPFVIGKDGTRQEVVQKYKDYILSNQSLLSQRCCLLLRSTTMPWRCIN